VKVLRPYQQEAVEAALKQSECTITMATGLGKTVTAVELSRSFASTMFVVDSEELADQARDAFKFIYPEVGLIKADVFDIKPVTISSIQTLYRRLDKLSPDEFQLIIVDEAHGYLSKQFRRGIEHFSPKLRCGITATPERLDNLPLSDLFGEIAFEYNIRDGIRDGYLIELNAIRKKTNVSLDSVGTVAGELNQGQLSNEINTLARNNIVVGALQEYGSDRKATIAFCCSIEHAMDLAEAFNSKGIKATAVSSDEKRTGDRTKKIADFREGKYDVICNVNILTKGFDAPFVDCIINAAPTKSRTRFLQGIGRGTRPLTGVIDGLETIEERWSAIKKSAKKDCLIIDITDNSTRHNLINCWELDKELPPEDRVFITQENRQKLIDARLAKSHKLDFERKEDEKVNLIKIPRIKINLDSEGMRKSATEKQLQWLASLGYNIEENTYSMGAVQQIVGELPASRAKVEDAARLGYDTKSKVLTNNDINAIQREIWNKQNKKK